MSRRVAVTGIGVVAPGGIGVPAFWELLAEGRTATRGITFFDPTGLRSRIAAECDFDPAAHGLDAEQVQGADRYIQFALVAGEEAVRDSGLDLAREDPWRVGVSLGTAVGGTTRLEHDYVLVSHRGQRWDVDHTEAEPQLHRAFSPSTVASAVAERFGAQGPVQTVSTGCTSGLDAVGYAFHTVQEGRADICIAGASDSPISPITMACFDAIKATSPNNDDPAHASRPFDNNRDGFVMGEGGAVLVLEELEHARARGAHVYCEFGGYATFGNAYHMTGLTKEGLEMARAIDTALDQARLDPTAIDYVNAHGSGT
ncbi:beta-ketoacyl-[acyl-carrier-protein] synthase family protein, partial [Streptomyces capoamus]